VEQISEHQIIKLKIASLKEDESNPNFMTEEKLNGLRESMRKWGFLHPIVVDQNNVIADGHHRVKIYKEFGRKTIEGYRKKFEDANERYLFRQVANKLHGEHDPEKDYKEIEALLQVRKDDLYNLLQISESSLKDLQSVIDSNKKTALKQLNEMTKDGNPTAHYADTFLHGNIKQITLFFDNPTYEKAIEMLNGLMEYYKLDNHTDLLWTVMNYVNNAKPEMESMTVAPPEKQKRVFTND
jgi:ParB-like nuclease family protein